MPMLQNKAQHRKYHVYEEQRDQLKEENQKSEGVTKREPENIKYLII